MSLDAGAVPWVLTSGIGEPTEFPDEIIHLGMAVWTNGGGVFGGVVLQTMDNRGLLVVPPNSPGGTTVVRMYPKGTWLHGFKKQDLNGALLWLYPQR